jgi:hypothetical protein
MKLQLPGGGGVEIDKEDYGFLQKIVNSDFVGLIGVDWIRHWRWSNLVKIAGKVRKRAEEQNFDPKKVAPKFIREFFENASLEENDDMQTMWANLLVNQVKDGDVNIHYLNILKELEPTEARLLDSLYGQSLNSINTEFEFEPIQQAFGMEEVNLKVLIYKLYSFNILRPPLMSNVGFEAGGITYAPALETIKKFRFTEMGLDFCKKCN